MGQDGDKDWIDLHAEEHRVQLQMGQPPVWAMFRLVKPPDPVRPVQAWCGARYAPLISRATHAD